MNKINNYHKILNLKPFTLPSPSVYTHPRWILNIYILIIADLGILECILFFFKKCFHSVFIRLTPVALKFFKAQLFLRSVRMISVDTEPQTQLKAQLFMLTGANMIHKKTIYNKRIHIPTFNFCMYVYSHA